MKCRGNPSWGKPEPIGPVVPIVTEFEKTANLYKLTPDQYPPILSAPRVGAVQ
jgi:hypothetical protein